MRPKGKEPTFGYMIDEPSPFAPMEELRSFLKRMEELPQDDLAVQSAVEYTKKLIAEREAEEMSCPGRDA